MRIMSSGDNLEYTRMNMAQGGCELVRFHMSHGAMQAVRPKFID